MAKVKGSAKETAEQEQSAGKSNLECPIRSPICVFEGHVDHGKSSLLDRIRGSSIVESEPGKITQGISAYLVPIGTLKNLCGTLCSVIKMDFAVPGLLFIDTPGHAAFTNLRKRGGSIADFAVVVIDINEGFMPQTIEVIENLKSNKTPFLIAANKVDVMPGWNSSSQLLLQNIASQTPEVQRILDERIYKIVEELYKLGFESERFDRVENFTKQIAIVPVSARTGEGVPEMLSVIIGLAQRYLQGCLKCYTKGYAKGSVLEVKTEPGIGSTLDVIIYDGTLNKNDIIVIGGIEKPIVSKVRGLLEQTIPHRRDKKYELKQVDCVHAAAAVRIMASDVEDAISGMPILVCSESELEETKEQVQEDVNEIVIETEEKGVLVKAGNLGALEALSKMLREKGIQIRKASLGNITKKDIVEAETNIKTAPLNAVILGFDVALDAEAKEKIKDSPVKIIISNVVYSLIGDFENWKKGRQSELTEETLSSLVTPCKIMIMPQCIFRNSNPAVVGVDIIAGVLKVGTPLMKEGKEITRVREMQSENKNIALAEKGKQVAVSLAKVTVGRQINGNDTLYTFFSENDFRKLKKLKQYLKPDEIDAMKEIAEIMRKENPLWGV